jgi:hypothetical protein
MPLHDPTIRLIAEQDDDSELFTGLEAFDDDVWREEFDEARGRMPPRRGPTPFVRRPAPTFRPSPAVSGARVSTPAGASAVGFQRPVATAQAIEQLKQDVQKAIAEVRQETRTNLGRIDDRLKSATSEIDTLGKAVKAGTTRVGNLEQRSQMFALMPFLQGRPKVEKIKFNQDVTALPTNGAEISAEVKYKDDRSDMLLPLVLMGGFGGSGTSSGDNTNMALIAVAMMGR